MNFIMISDKVKAMDVSGVRKMFEMASKIKNPIDMTVGLPDFDVPEEIKGAAIDAINSGFNRYTQTKGLPELREKIVSKLLTKNNISTDLDNVFVTSAGSGCLSLVFSSVLDKNDEVIIFDPYFVAYKQLTLLNEAKPVFVKTNPDFSINFDLLKEVITSKTKMIVINSPGNPTGYVSPESELRKLAKICSDNDLLVVSDEMYEDFVYGEKHFSIGSIYDKTISVFGFSKSHAMTGWRVGYFTGPKEIIDAATKVSQFTFVCAPTPFQHACVKAVDYDISNYVLEYREKRDIIFNGLKDKFEIFEPKGAFYAFIKYPYESEKFISDCLENNLLVVPGNVFSEENTHFRISFANKNEVLEKAIKILNNLIK